MKMILSRENEKATYNQNTGLFTGSADLVSFVNTYIYVFGTVGSNAFERLINDSDAFNITVTEYEPEIYPAGTLDA